MPYKCPECNSEIDYFKVYIKEEFLYYVYEEEWDFEEGLGDGAHDIECPECTKVLSTEDSMLDVEEFIKGLLIEDEAI